MNATLALGLELSALESQRRDMMVDFRCVLLLPPPLLPLLLCCGFFARSFLSSSSSSSSISLGDGSGERLSADREEAESQGEPSV